MLVFLVIVGRLSVLMIAHHAFYAALASDQQEIYQKLFPKRGDIAVKDPHTGELRKIATNRTRAMLWSDGRKIKDAVDTAERLAPLIGIVVPPDKPENTEARVKALEEKQKLLNKLAKKNDPYEVLKRGLDDETVLKIKDLNVEGLKFFDERVRFYPEPDFGGHLTGFVGYDRDGNHVGRYGIEGFFEKDLAGKVGFLQSAKSGSGSWISLNDRTMEEAEDGSTVVLTIDEAIQFYICDRLKTAVKVHQAERGAVVVLDAKTGAILGSCSTPDFDPNDYGNVETPEAFNNLAIYGTYEPGSVMKAITMAAAMNEGKITPNTTYEDRGKIELGNDVIKNSDSVAHGIQTMTQVLEKSLNTGAFFAAEKLDTATFKRYLQDFGFGRETGIELDTEMPGNISALDKDGRIYKATVSFGQGMTASVLQLASAFGAIANKGVLMKPHIVSEIQTPSGRVIPTEIKKVRQVISERTASLLSAMLVSVVENGHGKKAGVSGYYVAGKTGTAQIPRKDGRGYEVGKTIGTFAGFAPVNDPRFVLVTRIDAPKDAVYAEATAAPLFGDIAKFLLQYMEVPTGR